MIHETGNGRIQIGFNRRFAPLAAAIREEVCDAVMGNSVIPIPLSSPAAATRAPFRASTALKTDQRWTNLQGSFHAFLRLLP